MNYYRNQSSFSVERLQEILETKEVLEVKRDVFQRMESDQLFHKWNSIETLNDARKLTNLQTRRIVDYGFHNDPRRKTMPLYFLTVHQLLCMHDPSLSIKVVVSSDFFGGSIRKLGSEEHKKWLSLINDEKISGCFAMTEVGHGTNAQKMQTTATFDPNTQQFILHTPDFEAAKCWAGNLGQGATHATVLAQLITPDGKNQGVHMFIAPIRDPNTFLAYPGVTVGDMGPKLGLNGTDNGFCIFNQYRIPKENLLNKFGDVTEDGQYYSPIEDSRKRFAFSMGTLIDGRTWTVIGAIALLTKAITIAVRYSAARKQFGPTNKEELSIIEYPLQQYRLLPNLAALFCMKACSRVILTNHFYLKQSIDDNTRFLTEEEQVLMTEMHSLLSACKVAFTWTTQAAVQHCREACGGHGYLKCSGLGDLRNDNDAACTYEGDNNVLQQQTSNWLMRLWLQRDEKVFPSPLHTVSFLYQTRPGCMAAKSHVELCHPPVLLEAYQWLICWLTEKTVDSIQNQTRLGKDQFTAKNYSQLFRGKSLSLAYAEHYQGKCLWDLCCESQPSSPSESQVLTRLCALYLLTGLESHASLLYQGGYIDREQGELIQNTIVTLCGLLKNDAVSLVDVVAPPDFILNSVIGHSNGQVYKNLELALMTGPGNLERPEWWQQMRGKFRSHL